MRRLLLVRHAVTEETGSRLSGWKPGLHLTADGRAQAQRLAERLAPVPVDAIYSSPLERCQETAHALADPRDLPVIIDEAIGEVRYGDWTGLRLRDLAKLELWRTVALQPSRARFPGGESLYEMQVRAVAACERLRETHQGQTVVVCSHADVIKAVAAHYLGMHLDQFQRLDVGPASLTAFGFFPSPILLRLNERDGSADLVPDAAERQGRPEQLTLGDGGDGGDEGQGAAMLAGTSGNGHARAGGPAPSDERPNADADAPGPAHAQS